MIVAGPFSVAAQERPVLTVDRAVHRAIGNSEQIRQQFEREIVNAIDARQIRQRMREAATPGEHLELVIQLMRSDITMAFQHTERAAQRAQIAQSIQEAFLAIINAEAELEFLDRRIALERQNLRFDRIRYESGLIGTNEFNEARRRLQMRELDRERLEVSITRAHRALVSIVGGSRNTRYDVELDIRFEPLNNRPLDDYISVALGQNVNLRRQERELSVRQYELDARVSYTRDERTLREIPVAQFQRQIVTERQELADFITDIYEQVREYERELIRLRMDYEAMQLELEINEARLEMDRMTQLEFDEYVLGMDEARVRIRTIEAQHSLARARLLNPNLHR